MLILGRPGVGKTTLLREAARILAESKRVVIVDTSNEIGGDGDVPHPAVGKARRMQVREPMLQHEVMIEAVENHNPEVIVIDEIGRELEAAAARTIAERGVQLIGTAHGQTLDNLLLNPTLSDLVGGIEAVTLSDEEARRRGTQKTVLERRAPPTFDVLIEIQNRDRFAVHKDITAFGGCAPARLPAAARDPHARAGGQDPDRKGCACRPAPGARRLRRNAAARARAGWNRSRLLPKPLAAAARTGSSLALQRLRDGPHLSVRRGAQPPDAGRQATGRAGHRGAGCRRSQRAGDAAVVLPRPPADHGGGRDSAACRSMCCAPTRWARWSSS